MDPSPSLKGDAEKHGDAFSVIDSKRVFPGYRGSGYPIDRRSESFISGRFRSHEPENSILCVFTYLRSSSLCGGDSASWMQPYGGLDDAPYRGAADVQSRGDFALTDSLREQRGDLRLMLLHRRGSSMRSAGFARLGDPRFDALSQDVALEFRKDGEHAGERSTARGGHVQCFRKRDESDAECAELLQGANQVEERASPSIQAPDEDGIDLTPASGIHHRFSLGAAFGAGADFFNFGDHAPAAALGIGTQGRELCGERLLVMGGDAGIEPNSERCSPGQKPLQNDARVIAYFPGFAARRPGRTDNYSLVPDIGTLFEEAPPRTCSTFTRIRT